VAHGRFGTGGMRGCEFSDGGGGGRCDSGGFRGGGRCGLEGVRESRRDARGTRCGGHAVVRRFRAAGRAVAGALGRGGGSLQYLLNS
jgi:hypothetical protein